MMLITEIELMLSSMYIIDGNVGMLLLSLLESAC